MLSSLTDLLKRNHEGQKYQYFQLKFETCLLSVSKEFKSHARNWKYILNYYRKYLLCPQLVQAAAPRKNVSILQKSAEAHPEPRQMSKMDFSVK